MKFKKETKSFTIEFTEPMLGTVPKNPDVYAQFIATKAPKEEDGEEEIKTVEEIEGAAWTGFHRDENGIFIYNYMVKGQIKAGIECLIENGAVKKIVAYKKWIDRFVQVNPRKIYFGMTEPDGIIERPLRAMTAKGERITVTRSDIINPGRRLKFKVDVYKNSKGLSLDVAESALQWGEVVGLGQWRGSGGYGRFKVFQE